MHKDAAATGRSGGGAEGGPHQEVVGRRGLQVRLEGLAPLEVRLQFVHFEKIVWGKERDNHTKNPNLFFIVCLQCAFSLVCVFFLN